MSTQNKNAKDNTDKDSKSDDTKSSLPQVSGTTTSKEKNENSDQENSKMPSPQPDDKNNTNNKANLQQMVKKLKIITNEHIDEYLLRLPYYHGFLLHEYQSMLLNEYGDYLIRVSVKNADENTIKGTKKADSKESDAKTTPQPKTTGKKKPQKFSMVLGVFYDKKERTHEPDKSGYSVKDDVKEILDVPLRAEIGPDGKLTNFYINRKKKFGSIEECTAFYKNTTATYKDKKFNLYRGIPLTSWELDRQNVVIESKKLGEGAFGEVRVGIVKSLPIPASSSQKKEQPEVTQNVPVAVKLLKSEEFSKNTVKEMMHEARLQLCMRNKNVIRTIGVCILKSPLFIVTELCANGSLKDYLQKHNCELDEKIRFSYGSARGVEYMHNKLLIHRDLAVRNILVTDKLTPKLADFGLTRYGSSYTMGSSTKIPIRYLAPETLSCFKYSQKSDVFTFGVLLWEVFENGKDPYKFAQPHQESVMAAGGELKGVHVKELIKKELWIKYPADTPPQIVQFVGERVFVTDEKKRATMTDIVAMLRTTYRAVTKNKEGPGGVDRLSFR